MDYIQWCKESLKKLKEITKRDLYIPMYLPFKKWDKRFQEEAGEDLVKLLCTNFLGETPECKDYRNYEEHQRLLEEVIFTQVMA